MSDEKIKVLQMVKDGTISIEEGVELLQALEPKAIIKSPQDKPATVNPCCEDESDSDQSNRRKRKPRYLYIQVNDAEEGKNVNIKIPIALAKFAGKFIPKDARDEMKEQGIDLDLEGIINILEEEGEQNLVEVEDGENNKTVRIFTK